MRPIRFTIFWILSMAGVFAVTMACVAAWTVSSYNSWFLVIGTVNPPIIHLFFAWLYFRKMHHLKLSERIFIALLWVGLSVLATMASLKFVYGLDPIQEYSLMGIGTDALNFVAVLLAGYLNTTHIKKADLEKSAKNLELLEKLNSKSKKA